MPRNLVIPLTLIDSARSSKSAEMSAHRMFGLLKARFTPQSVLLDPALIKRSSYSSQLSAVQTRTEHGSFLAFRAAA